MASMIAGPQLGRADDRVDRADLDRALDRVHAVELGRDLAELLRPDARPGPRRAGAFSAARSAPLASASLCLQRGHPRVGRGAVAHLAGEHHRRGRARRRSPRRTSPRAASTVMFGLSALENTTNAPPW